MEAPYPAAIARPGGAVDTVNIDRRLGAELLDIYECDDGINYLFTFPLT